MGRSFKKDKPEAFKLWVRFKDGGKADLKSRDWNGKKLEPWNGLTDLEKYVIRHSELILIAMIWDKRQGRDDLIRHFKGGTWQLSKPITFDKNN